MIEHLHPYYYIYTHTYYYINVFDTIYLPINYILEILLCTRNLIFRFGVVLFTIELLLFLQFQVFHVGEKCTPHHAKETGANDLISDWNKCEIERLYDRPVDNAHFVSVKKLSRQLNHKYNISELRISEF